MLEFKLNYYFEKYKEYPLGSITKFKSDFINKEGNFKYLQELIVMIQKYQIKKYGNIIDGRTTEWLDNHKAYECERGRKYMRFGDKETRIKRNLERRLYEKYYIKG